MSDIIQDIRDLAEGYIGRDREMSLYFRLLAQVDELSHADLESFVSNEPRTLWNMATFLLQPRPLVHTITRQDGVPFRPDESLAAKSVASLLSRMWANLDRKNLRRGGTTFSWDMIGILNATGWFAIPNHAMGGKLFADYLHPVEVYPDFSDDLDIGLARVGRKTSCRASHALLKAQREGWDTSGIMQRGNVRLTEYHLWEKHDNAVFHGVAIGNAVVKDLTLVPGLDEIPILVGAVGGLPFTGSSQYSAVAPGHATTSGTSSLIDAHANDSSTFRGQSILATNANVFAQLNRQQTFLQQLLHDIANPKTYEKSTGPQPIVKDAEEFSKRGAHFKLGPNDDLGTLQFPGIPPEGTQLVFALRGMLQRGGFSDVTFGNIVTEISSLVMAQSAESAQQVISPYHIASQFIFTEVDNTWISGMMKNPRSYSDILTAAEIEALGILKDLPLDIVAEYSVRVPGDLAARINVARAAAPAFSISHETSLRLFMPEISDVETEIEKVRDDAARQHPAFIQAAVINALNGAADELEEMNPQTAQTYRALARQIMSQLGGTAPPPPPSEAPPSNGMGPGGPGGAELEAMIARSGQ